MPALVTYQSGIADSTRWERFEFRPGDVVISAPVKSGTTWTQYLVGLILFGGTDFPAPVAVMSPWLDMTIRSEAEAFRILARQEHRRFIKSHTPLDGIPVVDDVTYVCVGRDPRDAAISLAHHVNNLDWEKASEVSLAYGGDFQPTVPDQALPPDFFLRGWVSPDHEEALSLVSLMNHYRTAADYAERGNVAMFHFADYQADLTGSILRLAEHLGTHMTPELAAALAAAASIDRVRSQARDIAPDGQAGVWLQPDRFFRSGTSGQWVDLLTPEEIAEYHRRVDAVVDPALAHWIHHGSTT